MKEMRDLGDKIKELDVKVSEIDEKVKYMMLRIPNIPNPKVPDGKSDEDNVEVKRWSDSTKFSFEPKPHWDIASNLDIIDFERASKVTGSRFAIYKGLGARLERAVINYFLDKHIYDNGYTEILPPFMVNRESMTEDRKSVV